MSDRILLDALDCLPTAVSVFDQDDQLIFANSHYYAMLDLPMTHFPIGSTYLQVIRFLAGRGEYGSDVESALDERLTMIKSNEINVYQRVRPNGMHIEVTVTPLPCGGFVKSYENVTKIIELTQKLGLANRELIRETAKRQVSELEIYRLNKIALR